MSEPRTEAGKRLLKLVAYFAFEPGDVFIGRRYKVLAAILAIEAEAARPTPAPDSGLREALAMFEAIAEGQATDEEIAAYRLDADDPVNRTLNWAEWQNHAITEAVARLRSDAALWSATREEGRKLEAKPDEAAGPA